MICRAAFIVFFSLKFAKDIDDLQVFPLSSVKLTSRSSHPISSSDSEEDEGTKHFAICCQELLSYFSLQRERFVSSVQTEYFLLKLNGHMTQFVKSDDV